MMLAKNINKNTPRNKLKNQNKRKDGNKKKNKALKFKKRRTPLLSQ